MSKSEAMTNRTYGKTDCPICYKHFICVSSNQTYCSNECRLVSHCETQNRRHINDELSLVPKLPRNSDTISDHERHMIDEWIKNNEYTTS